MAVPGQENVTAAKKEFGVIAAPAGATPPTFSVNGSNAVGVTLKSSKVWVDITMTPGRKGANDVHITSLQPDGATKDVQDLTITFALPSDKIAPIKVPLRKLGPGHYLAPGFVVPINGTWRVTAKVLLSQFDLASMSDDLDVGGLSEQLRLGRAGTGRSPRAARPLHRTDRPPPRRVRDRARRPRREAVRCRRRLLACPTTQSR
jgi:hypothetical protein